MIYRILLLTSLAFAVSTTAQDTGPVSNSEETRPCFLRDEFRAFDFWLGNWEVTTADDKLAGHNAITLREQGCYLFESWRGTSGVTGSSINYYDAANKKWVQHWVSPNGSQIHIAGGLVDGSMVLVGEIYYLARAQQADFRGTWTPLDDGRVRQFFEQSNDGGKTWAPWFEGFYRRIEQIPQLKPS